MQGRRRRAACYSAMVPYPGFGIHEVFNGSTTRWGWTGRRGPRVCFQPSAVGVCRDDYIDFGTRRCCARRSERGITAGVNALEAVHLVKLGLNYKLGQGGVPWATTSRRFRRCDAAVGLELDWRRCRRAGRRRMGPDRLELRNRLPRGHPTCLPAEPPTGLSSAARSVQTISSAMGHRRRGGCQLGGPRQQRDAPRPNTGVRVHLPHPHRCTRHVDRAIRSHVRQSARLRQGRSRLGHASGTKLIPARSDRSTYTRRRDALGLDVGLGFEYAFTPAWTGKVEYDYMDSAIRRLLQRRLGQHVQRRPVSEPQCCENGVQLQAGRRSDGELRGTASLLYG